MIKGLKEIRDNHPGNYKKVFANMLHERWTSGEEAVEIADDLGCAVSSVHAYLRMSDHYMEPRRSDAHAEKRLCDMYDREGMTCAEIGKVVGMSATSVWRVIERHGVSRNRGRRGWIDYRHRKRSRSTGSA